MLTWAAFLALPWKKIAIVAVSAILLLFVILGIRSCFSKPKPVLNEAQIQKAQKAIAEDDRKALEDVYIEVTVEQKQINSNSVNATTNRVNAISEARKEAQKMTNEELAKELNQ